MKIVHYYQEPYEKSNENQEKMHTENEEKMHTEKCREKEKQFNMIQQLIESKEKFLFEKQKQFKKISKHNCFFENIKDDYLTYHNYIIDQKKQQTQALELLNEYIRNLTISGALSKQNVEDAKEEQKKILHEIKSIKENLNSIISNTNKIHSKL
jgi:hypothetical protein